MAPNQLCTYWRLANVVSILSISRERISPKLKVKRSKVWIQCYLQSGDQLNAYHAGLKLEILSRWCYCTRYEIKSPNLREATDVPSGLRNDSVPSSSFSTIHPSGTLDSASIFFHNICNFVQGLKVTGLLFCIPSNKNTFTFTWCLLTVKTRHQVKIRSTKVALWKLLSKSGSVDGFCFRTI